MFDINYNRRNAAALLASVAILLAGCGAAASPQWTYTPITAATAGPASSASAAPSATPPADTAAPAPSTAALNGATVTLSEWKVAMTATVKAGKATFTIANGGTTPHELLVFKSDQAPSAYPTNPAGGIVEDGAGVTLLSDGENIEPGKTQQRTVVLAAGTYLFVCNIPGHFNQGMFTVVTVTQ
jgi:uncharacterized cupredoxin-like copper-binding protein